MWMDLEAARDRQARVRRNLQARDGRYHGELSERDAIAWHEYRRTVRGARASRTSRRLTAMVAALARAVAAIAGRHRQGVR